MKYTGEFKNRPRNSDYPDNLCDSINITFLISDGYDAEAPITLSGEPISIKMESGDTIYKYLKLKTATVNILTGNYYFNLYNSTVNNVGLKVDMTCYNNKIKTTSTIFKGYVSPNLYDQSYNEAKEEISIECTDALSSLKYINYLPQTRGIKTLFDIVKYCVNQIIEPGIKQLQKPWLENIYIPNIFEIPNTTHDFTSKYNILDNIYVSDYALFDEKKEGEKDNDVCMTCADALEEICKIMGWTCTQEGNDIYFIDYDCLYAKYCKFNINSGVLSEANDFNFQNINIHSDKSYGTDNTLSLDNVYAKVSVKTKLRTFDSIMPNMFDGAYNITASSDYNLNRTMGTASGIVSDSDITDKNTTNVNKNMIFLIDQIYNDQKKKNGAVNAVAVRYYKSPAIKCYKYGGTYGNVSQAFPSTMNYTDSQSYRGGFLAKYWVQKLDNDKLYNINIDWQQGVIYISRNSFDQMLRNNNISEISLSNYICLFNPSTNNIDNSSNPYTYPFIETITPELTSFFGGKNTYLIISGKVIWHYKDDEAYPTPADEYDPREGRRETSTYSNLFIPCKLQWGNKYWNGDAWTTTNTGFKLYYVDALTTNSYRADGLICKEFDIPNNVSWRIGTKEKGYCIPIPDDGTILTGAPKFTIYRPWNPKYNKSDGNKYKPIRMFLKNFDIKNVIGDPTYSENKDTDTVYTNMINDAFINELDQIDVRLCTYDEKSPSYNSLTYKDSSGNYKYLDNITRLKSFNIINSTNINTASKFNDLRLEEHLINRYCTQYKSPAKIYEFDIDAWKIYDDNIGIYKTNGLSNILLNYYNIFNVSGNFILDKYEYDVKNSMLHIRLVEKK